MKAIYLGRFQPMHKGHKKVIEDYRDRFEKFELVIGSSDQSRTDENPLTAEEREKIIRECFPDLEISFKEDHESDKIWSERLEEETEADVILTQNSLVKKLVKQYTDLDLEEQELYNPEIYSGSEVRRRIKSDEEWRYLVHDCAKEKIEEMVDLIKNSGTQYNFEPGWKKENIKNS